MRSGRNPGEPDPAHRHHGLPGRRAVALAADADRRCSTSSISAHRESATISIVLDGLTDGEAVCDFELVGAVAESGQRWSATLDLEVEDERIVACEASEFELTDAGPPAKYVAQDIVRTAVADGRTLIPALFVEAPTDQPTSEVLGATVTSEPTETPGPGTPTAVPSSDARPAAAAATSATSAPGFDQHAPAAVDEHAPAGIDEHAASTDAQAAVDEHAASTDAQAAEHANAHADAGSRPAISKVRPCTRRPANGIGGVTRAGARDEQERRDAAERVLPATQSAGRPVHACASARRDTSRRTVS